MLYYKLILSSSSASSNNGSDIKSCFNIEDRHKETNTNTKLIGNNTNINDVKGGVNTSVYNIDKYNKVDLA